MKTICEPKSLNNAALFQENDAPILVVLGQSNAYGHGTSLPNNLRNTVGFSNVKGLDRRTHNSVGISNVIWSNYKTQGYLIGYSMDNTYNVIGEFSRMWQNEIDKGTNLPDLYVIHIGAGSQGIAEIEKSNCNNWWPGKAYSLYPLTNVILDKAIKNLRSQGRNSRIIGIHWNQWETEVWTGSDLALGGNNAQAITGALSNYTNLFNGFFNTLKTRHIPIYLYYPRSGVYRNSKGMIKITETLQTLVDTNEENDTNFKFIDAAHSPYWNASNWTVEKANASPATFGIFQGDNVHYNGQVQKWFALQQWKELFINNLISGTI